MTQPLFDRLAQRLDALAPDARRALARQATLRARELGLVVIRPVGDVDIPLTLSPELVEPATADERGRDAANLLGAVLKTARVVFAGGIDGARARTLFAHFGPLESRCLAQWQAAEDVTIARVDWFLDAAGRHRALELNATIPAMEAYSDAAARAWIETVGAYAGLGAEAIAGLVERNGSNAEELRRSIVAHAGLAPEARPFIAIVHREADSQQRELEALARHFRDRGHACVLATPGELQLGADGTVTIGGERPDVLYRHIFARRMPADSVLERIALGGARQRLQNPVNGHLEVKGLFAELVRLVAEEDTRAIDLTPEERATVQRVVPWTRVLSRDAALDPDGRRVADLAASLESAPERFVLKKSWDYGGKSVVLGRDLVAKEGASAWREQVQNALADGPGAWVVQELVDSPRRRHLVVGADGANAWEDVFVDASSYTASGTRDVPVGGVARWARVGVVNIVGGGGVAPLVRTDVAAVIADALGARAT